MRYFRIPYYIGDKLLIKGKEYKITLMNIRVSATSKEVYYEADSLDGTDTGYGFYWEKNGGRYRAYETDI